VIVLWGFPWIFHHHGHFHHRQLLLDSDCNQDIQMGALPLRVK
jgi:hypothetical protein